MNPAPMPAAETYQIRLTTTPAWYHCTRWWRWEPPPLPDFDFWYVAGGRGHLELDGIIHEFQKEQCFILRPGTRVIGVQDPNNLMIIFAVHFLWLNHDCSDRLTSPYEFPPGRIPIREVALIETMATSAERSEARRDELGHIQATGWVRQMLLQVIENCELPHPTAVDEAIEEIITLVRRAPEAYWDIQLLASKCHLSTSQFARRFRAATGLSPQHFLIRTRLERARQMLEETDMTQGHIAQSLGYKDLFFFARQYKQWMGEAPGATRKKVRG